MSDWNTQIIEEFRSNDGTVGGPFDGWTLLLLHHTGARSGTERVTPLAYQAVGDSFAIFASKGGAPDNPDWHYNLKANSETTVEVGSETVAVTSRIAQGDERDEIWSRQKSKHPQFAEYEAGTDRTIPVIVLDRR